MNLSETWRLKPSIAICAFSHKPVFFLFIKLSGSLFAILRVLETENYINKCSLKGSNNVKKVSKANGNIKRKKHIGFGT